MSIFTLEYWGNFIDPSSEDVAPAAAAAAATAATTVSPVAAAEVATAEGGTGGSQSKDCVVCMNSAANHLVIECGHLCGCEACLLQIYATTKKCPICCVPMVAKPIKVFFAAGV